MHWLGRIRLQYTSMVSVFSCHQLDPDYFCGVAGDGDNGAYEWFIWHDGKLQTSNCGYGDKVIALRDVLNLTVLS